MPNIASIFKAEISRVARKEVHAQIETLKKASAAHRASRIAHRASRVARRLRSYVAK
uniref:hypothetical protein n=1 Tax=unclassified Variovorax TaxID=663243 RepID=UPI00403A0CB3